MDVVSYKDVLSENQEETFLLSIKLEEKLKFLMHLFIEKIEVKSTAHLLVWYLTDKEKRGKKIEDIND